MMIESKESDDDDKSLKGDDDDMESHTLTRTGSAAAALAAAASPQAPRKSEEKCNAIKFIDICNLLEKMSKVRGSAAKLEILFNKKFRDYIDGESIFPLLRLILPLNDTERAKYGLKQALIAKTYVAALHLNKDSEAAKRLLNWKDPTKSQGVEIAKLISGDFGLILEEVLKERIGTEPSSTTLGEVNLILDDLANAVSSEEKMNIIKHRVLDKFNAAEQKWLARIIFQDLKVGLKHENVLGAFYPAALKRYNECTNLRTVCDEEGTNHSEFTGLQLFIHYAPMLAKGFPNATHGQLSAVEHSMNGQPFVMDLKLDGERILCHIGEDNSYIFYTRKGNDYTELYWPVAHDLISCLRKKGGKFSCILDGEILAINGTTKAHIPFGSNQTVARNEREYGVDKENISGWFSKLNEWMIFYVFDIVYLNGEDSQWIIQQAVQDCGLKDQVIPSGEITQLPLILRRKILERSFQPVKDRVEMIECEYVVSTDVTERKQRLENYFNKITRDGKEGLVVKNLNSSYELGEKSRGMAYWVKMKPEYGDHAADLDLLILGGYHGEGQNLRGQGISTFLLGVKDYDSNGNVIYQTFGKVGTGYTFNELTELREKLKEIEIHWNPDRPPKHLAHWKIAKPDDRPHVYYPPEESIVLQLKCAEIVESTSFSCGLTCRFPRTQKIRYDKLPHEILSVADIIEAKNRPRNTLDGENGEEGGEGSKKKRKGGGGGRKKGMETDTQFRLNLKEIPIPEDGEKLFEGLTFCVLENDFHISLEEHEKSLLTRDQQALLTLSREQLIDEIRKQGGNIVANAAFPNCKVIAGNKKTIQLKNIMDDGEKDVLDFKYVVDCLLAKKKMPIKGFYYLAVSPKTQEEMNGSYDVFGDSYLQDLSEKDLSSIFTNIEIMISRIERKAEPTKKYVNKKRKAQHALANVVQQGPDEEELLALSEWEKMKKLP
jgi:DNA ligase-4